ncbi:putative 4-aminobutyrate aminotransferase [Serendipita vermifera]|nr:putative 4-aminobutyrate aminotransferase [Serendipita vermifera]
MPVRVTCATPSYSQRGRAFSNAPPRHSPHPRGFSELVSFGQKHVAKGLNRLVDDVIESGQGSYVTMASGRKLLDFTTGIGVTNLGHCHPKVSKAAADQCMKITHAQCSIAFHEPYLELVNNLLPVVPKGLDTFFLWNSGAEAVEQSIKIARAVTGRQNVIAMQGGYHGRTYGTMALTRSKTIYSEGSAPLMSGVFVTPFPYWHQAGFPANVDEKTLVDHCLHQLDLVFSQQTSPKETAAILIEPVIGEGGYVPAPKSFLEGLRKVCDEHGIVLIFDEVQCGFGRTGKYFAQEWSGVLPDVMVFAKGVANGFPLSGVVGKKALLDKMKPGTMGGTYAGNAVSCAAAVACAKVMKEENVLENVQARSKELFAFLHKMKENPSLHISDVRGQGLMVAVEFGPDRHDEDFSAVKGVAAKVSKRCAEKGLLILSTSVFEVIRFIPPLNISKEELAEGMQTFQEVVKEVLGA